MECSVCQEEFNSTERRPKSLPCGHTFCLRCLLHLPTRKCPIDRKVFKCAPQHLVENFIVLQARSKPAGTAPPRMWCRGCNREAAEECVDDHPLNVCSLKKARAEDAGPLLESLLQGEAALDELRVTLSNVTSGLEACRGQLEQDRAVLVAAQARLRDAQGADAAAWEVAKRAAVQDVAVVRADAPLMADLATVLAVDLVDPSATCSVVVRRGAAGSVAWRGEARPADDAAARLLLFRVAAQGGLRQELRFCGQQGQAPAARWLERSNDEEGEMPVEEMAARLEPGARVERGRDWLRSCSYDGLPPGPGTVTKRVPDSGVHVLWDRTGRTEGHRMGYNGEYRLRLLATAPLKPLAEPQQGGHFLDVGKAASSDLAVMAQMLKDGSLAQVRSMVGLPCSRFAPWSEKVLEQVAPHLEALELVSPLQRHLDVVRTMPLLQALSITGVTAEALQIVGQLASLRRLELHCPLAAPLPVLALAPGGLQWLRCGVYPLAAALALVRAHADSLQELQLVAASTEPYGCPDLSEELRRCGLKNLKRLVLLRESAYCKACRHDKSDCVSQVEGLWNMCIESNNLNVVVLCSVCHRASV